MAKRAGGGGEEGFQGKGLRGKEMEIVPQKEGVRSGGGGAQERNDIGEVFAVGDFEFDELSLGFGYLLVFPFPASLGGSC